MIPFHLLWHYFRTRKLHFTDRARLEAWQDKKMRTFRRSVLTKSPWFRRYLALPFQEWPTMDKALMMAHFDDMNTAGLQRDELVACALRSEQSRDFSPKVGRFSVGLSSGTSGRRGLFVVSPQEQTLWAGAILAKVLPDGLLAGERVALFLRADNNLYRSVNNRWLNLAFYDLLAPFAPQLARLEAQSPTIIVAPAQVLRALALEVLAGTLTLTVKKVISVAEVLEDHDRVLLRQAFGEVGEIYQATEGFLASTCVCGTLHLNEEFIHVEPEWLDEHRFIPIITDFTRRTQPVVRYRLDDVLVAGKEPCPCGSVTRTIARIEGRQDDSLQLPDASGQGKGVFADPCSRVLAITLPPGADYRLVQTAADTLCLTADCKPAVLEACQLALNTFFARQGIDVQQLKWQLVSQRPEVQFGAKRRRIIRQWRKA